MMEPEDVYAHAGEPFALQFVALGKFPLTYKWYKVVRGGADRLVGTDSTVFGKVAASTTDQGDYYATVEDADGNKLVSVTVNVGIRPPDLICRAGRYGRESPGSFVLVEESYVPNSLRDSIVTLDAAGSSHTMSFNCSQWEDCSGTVGYQCVGGKFVPMQATAIEGQTAEANSCFCY